LIVKTQSDIISGFNLFDTMIMKKLALKFSENILKRSEMKSVGGGYSQGCYQPHSFPCGLAFGSIASTGTCFPDMQSCQAAKNNVTGGSASIAFCYCQY
jgi:hypothetical protein